MKLIDENRLILEKSAFSRESIEKRMQYGGFNSFSKFELFIWDLEMFLQLQRKLGDKIILKGGAATQFYLPVTSQRTSIDIDMICMASKEEVANAIAEIEIEMAGESDYCKFIPYKPKKPRVGLDELETFYATVPSVCNEQELFATKGRQQVKIEFLYSNAKYEINKIRQPELFALETEREFNILELNYLFADKLTTLGPNTIGVSDERTDEQFKQLYDVITLFSSNIDWILQNKNAIKENYIKVAYKECEMHDIAYNAEKFYEDMQMLIRRVELIENDEELMAKAYDFQGFYLRNAVNRDKAGWVIAAYQIDLLVRYIFQEDQCILDFRKVEELIEYLKFDDIRGPEKGKKFKLVRDALENAFGSNEQLTEGLFKKKFNRIIWELMLNYRYAEIKETLLELY